MALAGSVELRCRWWKCAGAVAGASAAHKTGIASSAAALIIGANPAVGPVHRPAAPVEIGRLEAAQRIGRQRIAPGLQIHLVQPGGVLAEDLGLVLLGDLLV